MIHYHSYYVLNILFILSFITYAYVTIFCHSFVHNTVSSRLWNTKFSLQKNSCKISPKMLPKRNVFCRCGLNTYSGPKSGPWCLDWLYQSVKQGYEQRGTEHIVPFPLRGAEHINISWGRIIILGSRVLQIDQ